MHTARDSTGARRIGPLVLLVGFHLSLVLLPARAQAPPEDDPFAGVEEMIVFGKETIGTLTDAAVSVTSFDASDLAALGVEDISDISQFTPNLEIRTAGSTAATFAHFQLHDASPDRLLAGFGLRRRQPRCLPGRHSAQHVRHVGVALAL